MSHLDGGLTRLGIAVERQEPAACERVDHRVDGSTVDTHPVELRSAHPSPRVFGPLAERDQAQEQLLGSLLARRVRRLVQLLSAARERPRDAADLAVGLRSERAVAPPVEQLGERVLQQRERAGLLGNVRHDLGDEGRFDPHPGVLSGPGDRALQLLGRQRDDRLGPRAYQLGEAAVRERAIVEVGTERRHDPDTGVRIR